MSGEGKSSGLPGGADGAEPSDAPSVRSSAGAGGAESSDVSAASDVSTGAEPERESGGTPPPWRNPWVIAFVMGAVTLTLLRPCMQYIPEAPPVQGVLGEVALEGLGGEEIGPDWFADHAVLLHFFFARDTRVGPVQASRVEELHERWTLVDAPVRILSVSVAPEQDDEGVRSSWLERRGAASEGASGRWQVAGGSAEGVRSLIAGELAELLGFGPEAPDDLRELAWRDQLILIDGRRGIRGLYEVSRDDVVDEVFHRALHVVRDQSPGGR